MGIPARPGSYVRDFAAMYRFEEGKIAERWVVRDDLGMLRQLGAIGDASRTPFPGDPASRNSESPG